MRWTCLQYRPPTVRSMNKCGTCQCLSSVRRGAGQKESKGAMEKLTLATAMYFTAVRARLKCENFSAWDDVLDRDT